MAGSPVAPMGVSFSEQQLDDDKSLLSNSEVQQFLYFDPSMKPQGTWDPPEQMLAFAEKHFNIILSVEVLVASCCKSLKQLLYQWMLAK